MNEDKFVRNRHRAFHNPKVRGKKKEKPYTIGDVIENGIKNRKEAG